MAGQSCVRVAEYREPVGRGREAGETVPGLDDPVGHVVRGIGVDVPADPQDPRVPKKSIRPASPRLGYRAGQFVRRAPRPEPLHHLAMRHDTPGGDVRLGLRDRASLGILIDLARNSFGLGHRFPRKRFVYYHLPCFPKANVSAGRRKTPNRKSGGFSPGICGFDAPHRPGMTAVGPAMPQIPLFRTLPIGARAASQSALSQPSDLVRKMRAGHPPAIAVRETRARSSAG